METKKELKNFKEDFFWKFWGHVFVGFSNHPFLKHSFPSRKSLIHFLKSLMIFGESVFFALRSSVSSKT